MTKRMVSIDKTRHAALIAHENALAMTERFVDQQLWRLNFASPSCYDKDAKGDPILRTAPEAAAIAAFTQVVGVVHEQFQHQVVGIVRDVGELFVKGEIEQHVLRVFAVGGCDGHDWDRRLCAEVEEAVLNEYKKHILGVRGR